MANHQLNIASMDVQSRGANDRTIGGSTDAGVTHWYHVNGIALLRAKNYRRVYSVRSSPRLLHLLLISPA